MYMMLYVIFYVNNFIPERNGCCVLQICGCKNQEWARHGNTESRGSNIGKK